MSISLNSFPKVLKYQIYDLILYTLFGIFYFILSYRFIFSYDFMKYFFQYYMYQFKLY